MDNTFFDLIQKMNQLNEGYDQPAAPGGQVKGKQKAGKAGKNGSHPLGGQLVGEEDKGYGFLSKYIPEEDVEEDLVTSMKREMNDYMKDRKVGAEPKKFSAKGTRARKPKAKTIWSKEDPKLMDSDQLDEGYGPDYSDYDTETLELLLKHPDQGGMPRTGPGQRSRRYYMAAVRKELRNRDQVNEYIDTEKLEKQAQEDNKKGSVKAKKFFKKKTDEGSALDRAMKPIKDKEKMFPKKKKKEVNEDWGSSDMGYAVRMMDEQIDSISPESIMAAAQDTADFYDNIMGDGDPEYAAEQMKSAWLRSSERGKALSQLFAPVEEGVMDTVKSKAKKYWNGSQEEQDEEERMKADHSRNMRDRDTAKRSKRLGEEQVDEYAGIGRDIGPKLPGMDGPFKFRGGLILYFDNAEGKYYNNETKSHISDQAMMKHFGVNPDIGPRESVGEDDEWNSKKFGAAVKRDQSSRVKAIRKAKSWMKRTGKSAAEAAKEFDINAKDLKEASPEKSQGRRDAGSYGRPGSEQQKKAASKSTRKFGQNQIDAEMSDMNATDDITNPNQGAEGPYAIVWHGQYHEWYGDDTPESGVGRYKPKGDAGNILAINVPTHEEAQKVLSRVEHLAADQGKWGVDGGVVHSDGAEIVSMKELGDHFQGYREGSYYSNKEDSHHQNMIDFTADNA